MTQSWIAVPIRKRNTKGGNWNWNGKWTREIKKKKKKKERGKLLNSIFKFRFNY